MDIDETLISENNWPDFILTDGVLKYKKRIVVDNN